MTSSPAQSPAFVGDVTFGDLLKQLRKRAGMTQADLAAAVGYSAVYISNLELNRRLPDLQVVSERFVPALGLHEEPHFARRLLELAALARGERLPATTLPPEAACVRREERGVPAAGLPLSPTELVGRSHEVKTLCNRLLGHNGRLLTLTGPPGIGKTRLALALAEKMQELYRDGVFFVALAAVDDAGVVAATIAAVLGIESRDERTPQARLVEFLRRKQLLLVLDNFEQILTAGALVAEILAQCAGVRLLVTSRERLHLRAEQRYRVPPLAVEDAAALFVQRAQAAADDFEVTPENAGTLAQICRLLDCLPLAIELSAARMDLFTPQALFARLQEQRLDLLSEGPRDLPARHRTLRHAIQHSYALLDGGEQRLFRALGVFAGAFELEAAVALGGDEGTLQALVHKSLVQVAVGEAGGRRFLLLETLREYAWEQLSASGEAAATQFRHAGFYLQLAEAAATKLRGPTQALWLDRLALEAANLRAALASSLAAEQIETGQRLGVALWRFWDIRGHYAEGMQWLEQLVAQPGAIEQRAKLLYGRGMLARRWGDLTTAWESLAASLALYRQLQDRRGIASALRGLGFVHYFRQEYDSARPLLEEALALFRALDDTEGIAATLDTLGYVSSDPHEEQRLYEESLALRRRSGNLRGIGISLGALTFVAICRSDFATAWRYIQERQQIEEAVGNQSGIAYMLNKMGIIAFSEGDAVAARSFYERSMKVCEKIGDAMLLPSNMKGICMTLLVCGEVEGVAALLEQALLIFEKQGNPHGVADVLATFATLAVAQGEGQRAITLEGAALMLTGSLTDRPIPAELALFEETQAAARRMLGEREVAEAWEAGQRMTLEQAVAYALGR